MSHLAKLLINQPIQWHPTLRVAMLDAAFIQMCSHSIDTIGKFHDVVMYDFEEHGVSVEVICIETEQGVPQLNRPPYMTSIWIFEPVNFVMRREEVDPPDGLDQFYFEGDRDGLLKFIAGNEFVLRHARDMRDRFGAEPPVPDLCGLINSIEVFAANREMAAVLKLSKLTLPASHG